MRIRAMPPQHGARLPSPGSKPWWWVVGLYVGYITTNRALLDLYGWDATEGERRVSASAQRITKALTVERQRLADAAQHTDGAL
jgi:hypothetical protein